VRADELSSLFLFLYLFFYRIKDKNGETVIDLLPNDDTKLRALIRKYQAKSSISRDDVASGKPIAFTSTLKLMTG
jgi:hypothetical protein